jgi:hypothetical protein
MRTVFLANRQSACAEAISHMLVNCEVFGEIGVFHRS